MSAIHGTFVNGAIVPDAPPGWPDGTRVVIDAAPVEMMAEDEQGDDPESIARWIAWLDSLEPLILTTEDEERIQKARAEQKAWELANWEAHSKKIEDLFK